MGPPGAPHARSCFQKPEEPGWGRRAERQQCAFTHVCLEGGFLHSVCCVSMHMGQAIALAYLHLLLSYALGHPIALLQMCVSRNMYL